MDVRDLDYYKRKFWLIWFVTISVFFTLLSIGLSL